MTGGRLAGTDVAYMAGKRSIMEMVKWLELLIIYSLPMPSEAKIEY